MTTDTGDVLPYDSLVLALGARPVPAFEHATTFSPADADALTGLLRDLEEGYSSSVAFVIPPGPVWPSRHTSSRCSPRRRRAGWARTSASSSPRPSSARWRPSARPSAAAVEATLRDHSVELVTEAGTDLDALGVERIVALPRLEGRPIEGVAEGRAWLPRRR